jgi:hypothetical protein
LTRAAFNANTGKPAGQNDSQSQTQAQASSQPQDPQQRPRYDESIECEGCGRLGYAQKDCYTCNYPTSRGRGRGRGGRNRDSSRGRGGRGRDG